MNATAVRKLRVSPMAPRLVHLLRSSLLIDEAALLFAKTELRNVASDRSRSEQEDRY